MMSAKGDGAVEANRAQDIILRIEDKLGAPGLAEKLARGLSASDYNSLMMKAAALRSGAIRPPALLRQYGENRYAHPAACSAAAYRRLEADMLAFAEDCGAQSVLLSPAAAFGSCSVFGAVSQNKVISAARGLEIVSDATNMLALHIADGFKNGTLARDGRAAHICTTHRHIRYQAAFGNRQLPHFGLFAMASAGESRSSYGFEAEALMYHLRLYREYWRKRYGAELSLTLNPRPGYKDAAGFFGLMAERLQGAVPGMDIAVDERESGVAYYQGLQGTLRAPIDGEFVEVGDLGFTDWTQKLLGRPGERLLISAVSLDRQIGLATR